MWLKKSLGTSTYLTSQVALHYLGILKKKVVPQKGLIY